MKLRFPHRCLAAAVGLAAARGATEVYLRSPAIRGETAVFTAEGDLWKVPVAGGTARRLTTHPADETSAAISPDGKWIAFSAAYEGPTEVYAMPADGGLPQRLTWDGEGSRPVGWTPDGRVLCATHAHSTLPNVQLVAIDPASGASSLVPLAQAAEGTYDPTGKVLYFTRLSPQSSSTKRYQGGTAQNLWRYEDGAEEAEPLTGDYRGTSKNPMFGDGRVFFLSDRGGSMNLWSMPTGGGEPVAITNHHDFDIRTASLDAGRIVYQWAGQLRLHDLARGSDEVIPITIESDFDQTRERWIDKPFDYLTRSSLSPDGTRLALTARGSVFVAPVKPGGRLVEIAPPAGARYRQATFLPGSDSLVAQTDETGEIEMVRLPANGVGTPELLTDDGTIFRHAPIPSPDGKQIAWEDKNLDLWVRELDGGRQVKVSTAPMWGFQEISWSPDGRWLAFVEPAENTFHRIRLFDTRDGTVTDATSDRVRSFSPAWSADGKWLYFLSDRTLQTLVGSPWGPRQPEPFFTESTRIYALALQPGLRFPFTPPDELHPEEPGKDEPAEEGEAHPDEPVVEIEKDGLQGRLYEVPDVSGNLSQLAATREFLFYRSEVPGKGPKPELIRLKIGSTKPEPEVFATDPKDWELSLDGKSVALRMGDRFHVVPADGKAPAELEDAVPLDRWKFAIDPRTEWRQIYLESWRMLRDYFYDPAMHGTDWTAVRDRYLPLIDRVADRADLGEIMQEMAGELSALHTVIRFGDLRHGPDDIQPSSLGARFSRDAATGGWRIEHVYASDPDYPGETAPLARPGIDAHEGEVIVAINGRELKGIDHPEHLLATKAGQKVLLEIVSPTGTSRQVLVEPLAPHEAENLRYSEWELTRREQVEESADQRIGYVHLRNMGPGSILEWARAFYPVFQRQGLIIDMRHNRGGNTDSWILSRLLRKPWFYWSPRAGQPYSNMQFAFNGHLAVLCNEWTASDGEAFSEGVRRLGLGKIIGTRTWGGQIWLSARPWLVDNGMCTAAEFGVYSPEGEWLIEGTGVEPDITVDNLPHQTFLGRDAQLEAAVKHLLGRIAEDPRPVPPPPPRPDKSRR
ncbi:S41 family peptidase [Haloferula sargassicola]|uniref:Tricorn protease homolog n=1 Tax=Haloferula sargassicola TaxID=490096 RepID=A0ABP9UQB8_9BACT